MAAVAAAVVFLCFRLEEGFTWERFAAALRTMDPAWLTAAVGLILAAYFVRAWRWRFMIRPLAPAAKLADMLAATFIGFTAVVLFGRAGEPVRPFLIARKQGISFSSQVAVWLVERILDLLMILALFGFSLAHVNTVRWAPDSRLHLALQSAGWAAGLAGAGCLAALVALRQFRGRLRDRLEDALAFLPQAPRVRLRGILQAFDDGMQATRDPAGLWLLLVVTMLEWTLVGGTFLSVLRAFPAAAHLSLSDVLATMGMVSFAGVIQIPGVGGGMQIAAILVLTEMYGLGVEAASGVALLLWAVNFLTAVPLGLVWAFHEGIRWRTMRHVGDQLP
jgi:uncharacterized membrane protein YbhN (UPF0104 family)